MIPQPRFAEADAEAAFQAWDANCGPVAVAAICGLTLDELRPHLDDFETRRYTNPTLMRRILDRLGVAWEKRRKPLDWPSYGLCRIQWLGPWTAPGRPVQGAYRHTHWVGAMRRRGQVGVFDVNCLNNGSGWVSAADWKALVVPFILEHAEPRATGGWAFTHCLEVGWPKAYGPVPPAQRGRL